MKYKIGDKVRIKTWDQMGKEFSIRFGKIISCKLGFNNIMEEELNNLNSNRILTIIGIDNVGIDDRLCYIMWETRWQWSNDMIECLAEKEIIEPIISRFEILDL